ncbi:MAG TPA: twin-arginine translocase TatA/TatE family subunit [Coriobacteriia bacterium]
MNLDKTLIIVLIIVLVTMGPSELPKIARMLGKSAKALKDGINGTLDEEEGTAAASPEKRETSKK